ncbi:MAG TPA: flagellin [Rhodocyclaceae bacterium]|nr:flagellin [Rhodocyclaceae bacterium]
MAQVINTNVMSLNAQRNLTASQSGLATALQRLSSGLRVNSAKDDAAGLAIGTRMDAQVRGMNVAIRNASDGISSSQTAEGGLVEVTNALQRMRELAMQAANGTNTTAEISLMNTEYTQLSAEIDRIVSTTKFNGVSVLQATAGTTYQVGANSGDTISVSAVSIGSGSFSLSSLTDNASGTTAMTAIDNALNSVNSYRATLGAVQNRFQSTISNLQTSVENTSAAKSRIMDADFASETANLTRAQILQQAGTAMLAQANALPQNVLSLLK